MEGQGGYVDSETCGWVTVGCTEHNTGCTWGYRHVASGTVTVVL